MEAETGRLRSVEARTSFIQRPGYDATGQTFGQVKFEQDCMEAVVQVVYYDRQVKDNEQTTFYGPGRRQILEP